MGGRCIVKGCREGDRGLSGHGVSRALQPLCENVRQLKLKSGIVQESARSESFHNVPMLS